MFKDIYNSGKLNLNKKSARYFLVQKLAVSNKEASDLIAHGKLFINEKQAQVNQPVSLTDQVVFEGEILQEAKKLIYIAYYKPRGVETTLNKSIPQNLSEALGLQEDLFPLGRLDKQSEGLLLLTNDGLLYQKIVDSKQHQEKEYVVTVDKPLTAEAIRNLAQGVTILGKITRPASVIQIDECSFKIILTQGINRQIRRMCYKLGYEVKELIRTRIVNLELGSLKPGEKRALAKEEVEELKECQK